MLRVCYISVKQATAIASSGGTGTVVRHGQHRAAKYTKGLDQRKRAIRGPRERNGRYYARITVEDPHIGIKRVRRVPLEGASTSAQAVATFQELLTQRRKGALPTLKRALFNFAPDLRHPKAVMREKWTFSALLRQEFWIQSLNSIRIKGRTSWLISR